MVCNDLLLEACICKNQRPWTSQKKENPPNKPPNDSYRKCLWEACCVMITMITQERQRRVGQRKACSMEIHVRWPEFIHSVFESSVQQWCAEALGHPRAMTGHLAGQSSSSNCIPPSLFSVNRYTDHSRHWIPCDNPDDAFFHMVPFSLLIANYVWFPLFILFSSQWPYRENSGVKSHISAHSHCFESAMSRAEHCLNSNGSVRCHCKIITLLSNILPFCYCSLIIFTILVVTI